MVRESFITKSKVKVSYDIHVLDRAEGEPQDSLRDLVKVTERAAPLIDFSCLMEANSHLMDLALLQQGIKSRLVLVPHTVCSIFFSRQQKFTGIGITN